MGRSKKRILFITYDGLTDPLGQSQILPYLKGLSREYEIHILSCEKENSFRDHSEAIKASLKKRHIAWQYVLYSKNPPVLSTFFDLLKMKKLAGNWHRNRQFNTVHCRTVLAWLIGKSIQRNGAKLIFDMRGFWAEERVDGKLWDLSNPLFRSIFHYFRNQQIKAYRKADAVVSLTHASKDHIISRYGIDEKKISVIPCNADQDHFKAKSNYQSLRPQLLKTLNLNGNELIVAYAGSLGTRYLIEEMLDCFKVIREHHQQAIFLIVTKSPTRELEQEIELRKLKSSVRITQSTYDQIPEYLSLADLALYFIHAGDSGKAVSPTKQAEFLSMGIPIITNGDIGDSKEIIEAEGVGLCLEALSSSAYKQVAEKVPQLLEIPSREIIKIAAQYFQLEKGIESYRTIYQQL